MTRATRQPCCSAINSKEPCPSEGYMAKIYFQFCATQGLTGRIYRGRLGTNDAQKANLALKKSGSHQAKNPTARQGNEVLGAVSQSEKSGNFQTSVYCQLGFLKSSFFRNHYAEKATTQAGHAPAQAPGAPTYPDWFYQLGSWHQGSQVPGPDLFVATRPCVARVGHYRPNRKSIGRI